MPIDHLPGYRHDIRNSPGVELEWIVLFGKSMYQTITAVGAQAIVAEQPVAHLLCISERPVQPLPNNLHVHKGMSDLYGYGSNGRASGS